MRSEPDGVPFLQYVTRGRTTFGSRVFADGRVDAYSDQDVDDDLAIRPVPLAWRPRARLSADAVGQLQDAVRAGGFFALPSRLEPAGRVHDAATTTWAVNLDGRRHEVVAIGNAQAGRPELAAIHHAFEDLIADALSGDETP